MFLTLTLPSYGKVRHGALVDPDTYDDHGAPGKIRTPNLLILTRATNVFQVPRRALRPAAPPVRVHETAPRRVVGFEVILGALLAAVADGQRPPLTRARGTFGARRSRRFDFVGHLVREPGLRRVAGLVGASCQRCCPAVNAERCHTTACERYGLTTDPRLRGVA